MKTINPKQARLKLGLNQKEMAAAMGVHRQTWVKWERGERPPGSAAIRLIDTLLWLHSIQVLHEYLFKFLIPR